MTKNKVNDLEYYAEIPGTLYTIQGNTYHIDRKGVEALAPALLDKVSLAQMLYDADALVQAPAYLMYYVFLGSLWISIVWGISFSLATFLLAWLIWPVFSLGPLPALFRFISAQPTVFIVSAVLLSLQGMLGTEIAMWLGLIGFVALRVWVMFSRNRRMHVNPSQNDRILHRIIDRYALGFGLSTQRTAAMEHQLKYYLNYRRASDRPSNRNSKQNINEKKQG